MLFCLPLPSFRAPIPLWAHWNHVGLFPHLSVLTLITRAESLLPCEEIYSQVPRNMLVFAGSRGGAWFCHDLQAGLDGALGEIGVCVEVVQWPRQRVLMRPCIPSGRGEGGARLSVWERTRHPGSLLCASGSSISWGCSQKRAAQQRLQGFHDVWCSALTLMFLSEWSVEVEESACGDGVGYTTGEGQSGTGDSPCNFESTQNAKAGDKPLSKKRTHRHTSRLRWRKQPSNNLFFLFSF